MQDFWGYSPSVLKIEKNDRYGLASMWGEIKSESQNQKWKYKRTFHTEKEAVRRKYAGSISYYER